MFPACPLPKTDEDGAIYFAEGATTGSVPVIVGPTPYFAIEDKDQIGCCFGQPRSYGFPDVLQEGLNILSRRSDEQFPARVPAYILPEKIKACGHVRDNRLIWGEF
jgi:hypothetical protein